MFKELNNKSPDFTRPPIWGPGQSGLSRVIQPGPGYHFFILVKDKDWKHSTFGPVLKVTAHQDEDNAVGLGRNIYLAATQAAQRLLIQGIPDEEVNVAVHSVYNPNHSWFKELDMDDKLVTLADSPPRKFTNRDYEECRRAFMEEYKRPIDISSYNVDIDDF